MSWTDGGEGKKRVYRKKTECMPGQTLYIEKEEERREHSRENRMISRAREKNHSGEAPL